MPIGLVEARHVIDRHLEPGDVAAYVQHVTSGGRRARIEAHLARCRECRAEVREARHMIATRPGYPSWRSRAISVSAVAAAVLILALWPRVRHEPPGELHREGVVTTTVSPVVRLPIGLVDSVTAFVWSAVPHAEHYEVRVFDAAGSTVWHQQTTDTVVALPGALPLRSAQQYYWRVQATIGYERHATSELIEFSVHPRPRPARVSRP